MIAYTIFRRYVIADMNNMIAHIAKAIKAARSAKKLTQQELGERVGLPQSHISKIEQGRVDLQLSSLTEIARALDLEVTLVPRKSLPAVESAVRFSAPNIDEENIRSDLALHAQLARNLAQQIPQFEELTGFNRALEAVQKITVPIAAIEALQKALKPATDGWARSQRPLQKPDDSVKVLTQYRRSADELRALRNIVVHRQSESPPRAVPAYRLDDDE